VADAGCGPRVFPSQRTRRTQRQSRCGLAGCECSAPTLSSLMSSTCSTHPSHAQTFPPPRRGGCVETRTLPRVAHRPLCSGRCFTRGHSPPPRWGEKRRLQILPTCGLCVRSPALPLFSSSLRILHSVLLAPVPPSLRPFLSTFPLHWHGSCAHRPMPMRPCHKPSNSSQNRSKRGQNRVKKGQKRRAFRHAHLNILGADPLWR
jgi:hypothetical protein